MKEVCPKCNGKKTVSNCCDGGIINCGANKYKCWFCSKFCRISYCDYCEFNETIRVGDEISIYTGQYSTKNIQELKIFNKSGYSEENIIVKEVLRNFNYKVEHPNIKEFFIINIEDIIL